MTRSYKLVEEYEYTAHSSLVHSVHIPVAKFHYEPSPMQVLHQLILWICDRTYNTSYFGFFLISPLLSGLDYRKSQVLFTLPHQCLRYYWWYFYGQFILLASRVASRLHSHKQLSLGFYLCHLYWNSPSFVPFGCYRLPAYWTRFCTTQWEWWKKLS